tara:strand:+ start:372 stop:863 length:492 start_codon:yes stop_codon:yes gene_type:complete
MKKLTLLMLVAIMTLTQAYAQSKAPSNVKAAFDKKFPTAKKASWDKENETEWEVEFKMNGRDYSANFLTDGTWKETEYAIKKKEIPKAVKQTLNSQFKGYKIEESEVSETVEGKVYEFALEKGKSDLEVAIAPNGTVVKKEVKKDKEDKEKDSDNDNDNDNEN